MARIRSIKPEIWQDEALGRCTIPARVLYIGLITQADDEGRMRGAPELVRSLVFPYDPSDATVENVELWLQELANTALIVRYEVRTQRYIAVQGWTDHQKVDRPNLSKLPAPPRNRARRATDHARENSTKAREDSSSARRGLVEDSSLDQGSRIKDQGRDLNVVACDDAKTRPEVIFLCRHLAEAIVANDPKAKTAPESAGWRTACRLLIDADGRTPTEIQAVIAWATRDQFWRSNILSMPTLRKKFPTLRLQMERTGSKPVAPRDEAARVAGPLERTAGW